jgi:hypothetical protein
LEFPALDIDQPASIVGQSLPKDCPRETGRDVVQQTLKIIGTAEIYEIQYLEKVASFCK